MKRHAKRKTATTRLAKVIDYFSYGQWLVHADRLPLGRRMLVKTVQFCSSILIGFKANQCSLRAASLTFFSMMALVPVLVLALALARSTGGADLLKRKIDTQVDSLLVQMSASAEQKVAHTSEQAESETEKKDQAAMAQAFSGQMRNGVDKLFEQVNSINFATLGGVGFILLLWTVIGVLGKIESSFNAIWNVEKPRSLIRMCTDYLSVIILLPFLILAVSSVPVVAMVLKVMSKTMGHQMTETSRLFLEMPVLQTCITLLMGTILFTFLLCFMPNQRVKVSAACVGGFLTMVLFSLWLKACAVLQIGIAKYSVFYGSFALVPILLMWVYTSWQIILLGSEISFCFQNRDTVLMERYSEAASVRSKILFAYAFCKAAWHHVHVQNAGPFSAERFAQERRIPRRFVRDVLDDLVRWNVLAEVKDRPGDYLLCCNGDTLTYSDLVTCFLDEGEHPEQLGLDTLDASIYTANDALDRVLKTGNCLPVKTCGTQGSATNKEEKYA